MRYYSIILTVTFPLFLGTLPTQAVENNVINSPSSPVVTQSVVIPTPDEPTTVSVPVLLNTCQTHLDAKRLLTGKSGTAFDCYKQVLKIEPRNKTALDGLESIAREYETLTKQAIEKETVEKARVFLSRLKKVNPKHKAIAELTKEIDVLQQKITTTTEPQAPIVPPVEKPVPTLTNTHPHNGKPTISNPVNPIDKVEQNQAPVQIRPAPDNKPEIKPDNKIEAKKNLKTWQEPNTKMVFVWIPDGCFNMGSPDTEGGRYVDESPTHKACVQGFWMGQTEVTNAQYRLFKPSHDSGTYSEQSLNENEQPVIKVTWQDAQDYAQWLSKIAGYTLQLPTETQWEYAGRGGTQTPYFWGADAKQACQYANVHDAHSLKYNPFSWSGYECDDGFTVTAPVGHFQANPFGLYDIVGNVWEWTCTSYHATYSPPEKECSVTQLSEQVVVRGGAWNYRPTFSRMAARFKMLKTDYSHSGGFRLVRLK
ncbi:SUMF1/EgtB/PvdO family nonheme iron enzyme [Beggiatoa leptomitoformis]|uniref:SUMF1/EgtB/PvdO family nonheme iron enzyme n=1 Tax=Beggiatoa leptomitoformis TaxID=288004 RepID=A0A2N9YHC3_9GAMM|nr:SUMF1/EgtB/PvdO family nonheme iron enzyme [Beggiatoa leptomitoformis]ALG67941.1 SUMF1/EgtB/PvdO family nonheme iron enzyme [Beggiatoa leptomitoformis]AUI69785.1 SUMF1/EgtB/PvdO family nonheme iron enzyme [Beggiatoa leptomitoformis]